MERKSKKLMVSNLLRIGAFLIFLIPILYVFLKHLVVEYRLINEYKYIDEITILNGKEVRNSEFIKNYLSFEPKEIGEFKYSAKNIYFEDKNNVGLSFRNIPKDGYIILDINNFDGYKYLLNKYNGQLRNIIFSKHKNMTLFEYIYFNNILDQNTIPEYIVTKLDPNHEPILIRDFMTYPLLPSNSISDLKEKFEFILANIYEQNIQIFDRYYIHENSFVLSPINSMELGKPLDEIFSQYGFLSIKIVDWIMKIYGGVNINNYEKAKLSIRIFYLVSGMLLVYILFKSYIVLLMFLLLFNLSLFSEGYYSFIYAPTLVPMRHLLDIFIMFFLVLYGIKRKIIFLYISLFFGLLSIWIAKDFGIFLFLSLIAVLTISVSTTFIKENKILWKENLSLFLFIFLGVISIIYYPLKENPSIKYFFDGFYNFPFSNNLYFFIILSLVITQWIILIVKFKKLQQKGYLHIYIFLIFYTQFLYTYVVWHGAFSIVLNYIYIFSLPILLMVIILSARYRKVLIMLSFFILTIFYIKELKNFFEEMKRYDYIFETHKLYKWDYYRAGGIISTYSFEPFENSIELIRKHNISNEIFMISKYDNILTFLSEKYSGFPFFELRSTIVTENEFDLIKNIILEKANIIFVDNDIERNFKEEISAHNFFDIYHPLFEKENLMQRIEKLKVLKRLWIEVKDNYKLVERGKLISVYKRIK